MISTPPGEGERRAQRGYGRQYQAAAAAIWDALNRDELVWLGVADRRAGVADDIVLGLQGRVVGHQFKTSKFPELFRLETLLLGKDGLFEPLVQSWKQLSADFPDDDVEVRLVTTDNPSPHDKLIVGREGHSAAFLQDLGSHQDETSLAELRASRWKPWIDRLESKSGLDTPIFNRFLLSLNVIYGPRADFVHAYRLTPAAIVEAEEIADMLPRLVTDRRDVDRWTLHEFLQKLGWRDRFPARRTHEFPIGRHVQRNVSAENDLIGALRGALGGYVALIGPPGSGKSTTLQSSIISSSDTAVVRYLAFVPGQAQGIGRAEADEFLGDINRQLRETGLPGLRLQASTLQHRRDEFEILIRAAGCRFQQDRMRTLIVVDGLDHIPREETPDRSLLTELPLPAVVPDGVTFILGSQRLDLAALKPTVRAQAGDSSRCIIMSPLSRNAIDRMAEALGLDKHIDRGRIADVGAGHPLATRYLIEALKVASEERQGLLLNGEFSFRGDIEAVYAAAWREVDDRVRQIFAFLARAEGQISPEILARAVSAEAVDLAWKSAGHLLDIGVNGWMIFHNSFRHFILERPQLKFGRIDPSFDIEIYGQLAELSRLASAPSPQRWLELRYRSRAGQYARVVELAKSRRFRDQIVDGRPYSEILIDLRMVYKAVLEAGSANELFRILIAQNEVLRRSQALAYAPALVEALIAVGDLDSAMAYALAHEKAGFRVVDALLKTGAIDKARTFFDRIEPTATPSGAYANNPTGQREQVEDWACRAFHFRNVDQILERIDRFSDAIRIDGWSNDTPEAYAEELRFLVAHAALADATNKVDVKAICVSLKVSEIYQPLLMIEVANRAKERGNGGLAKQIYNDILCDKGFVEVSNGIRRRVALNLSELADPIHRGADSAC